MQAYRIGPDELGLVRESWDRAVDATPGADPFCTSSVWSFAAATSFDDVEPPVVLTDGSSFAGLRSTTIDDGRRILVGLDPIWGFATPLVGHPVVTAHLLDARLRMEDHDLALVAGQTEDGIQTQYLASILDDRRLLRGPTEQRLRADLGDGVDAWFARRSSRFRQRMRRIEREADAAGIEVVDVSAMEPDAAFDRILAIEASSWKGREDTGLASPDLAAFYRQVVWRLAASDALRLLVATRDGEDVGFILGGVRSSTYRGLQLSYREDVAGVGVGHLLQWRQLQRLDGTGIEIYDLGMDMDYKRRWADRIDETFAVIVTT